MTHACGNYDYIAGQDIEFDTGRVAEANFCSAAVNAEHFVGCAVVMMEAVDTVAPGAAPAVGPEERFYSGRRILVGQVQSSLVQQQRQCLIIGDDPVILKELGRHLRCLHNSAETIIVG